ncbi:hypothetical protein V6Z11_A01G149200 [Gossypium hirsutum]
MATEKRLQDDIWCGSYCSDIVRDEESYADTLQDHLDLDQGGERLSINNVSSRHAFGGTSLKRSHGPVQVPLLLPLCLMMILQKIKE